MTDGNPSDPRNDPGDFFEWAAAARESLHRNHASSRPLSEDYELVGWIGEAEFSKRTGLPLDLSRRLNGDAGVDFIVPIAFTVDVKTFRNPLHLICEQGKVKAQIYILASYFDETREARLIGWEWGKTLAQAPVRDFGYGILNHYIAADRLRPMETLLKRIMTLRQP